MNPHSQRDAVLRAALERVAALDDGDATYWWQGEPMEAIKHVRNILALEISSGPEGRFYAYGLEDAMELCKRIGEHRAETYIGDKLYAFKNTAPQGATGQQTIPKGPALPELPAAAVPEAGKEPFGWWDHFNGCLYFKLTEANRAEDGGNKITPLYERSATDSSG